jgi:hypothetical protein
MSDNPGAVLLMKAACIWRELGTALAIRAISPDAAISRVLSPQGCRRPGMPFPG